MKAFHILVKPSICENLQLGSYVDATCLANARRTILTMHALLFNMSVARHLLGF